MPAIDFPNSPSLNQVFNSGTRSWRWDGYVWRIISVSLGPAGPTGPTGSQGTPGATGPTGPTGPGLSTGKVIAMAIIFGG
jgi:hypothetical protein